eukprot:COSAG02_NODE_10279_length_1979_cov_1.568617_3_plen_98_part_00
MVGGPDSCPEYFLQNAHRQGTFVDCAGNTLADLRKNLELKHAAQHHSDNSSPDETWFSEDEKPTLLIAMISGIVVLVGAVMYQLCEFALRLLASHRI